MSLLPRRSGSTLPPPPDVVPWRVPPMGSIGDAWDEAIDLPDQPRVVVEAPKKKKREKYRPGTMDVVFREWTPKLHLCVIAGWILLAMAMMTTGPAYPLMPYLAMFGLLFVIAAAFLLRTIHRQYKGEVSAWVGIIAGIILLMFQSADPASGPYTSYFTHALARPSYSMTHEMKIKAAQEDMALMGDVATCAYVVYQDKSVAEGRNSMNGQLPGTSEYFRISTLRTYDRATLTDFQASFMYYTQKNLPKDPFADDAEAIYGVYVTEKFIIVYSAGPDGVWQMNPRKPVEDFKTEDPMIELAPFLWDPASGAAGSGDLVMILPLKRIEENDPYNMGMPFTICDNARQKLEARE